MASTTRSLFADTLNTLAETSVPRRDKLRRERIKLARAMYWEVIEWIWTKQNN